jgi:GT2 family glycosyltransferase
LHQDSTQTELATAQQDSTQTELATAQVELAKQREQIAQLQQLLEERSQEINKLIRWTQSLQQDITAVYHSITWQMGQFLTQIALKLLRRPAGPTARDHINKTLAAFESWKINYLQSNRQCGWQTYVPWHDTREYALWIKQYDTVTPSIQAQRQVEMQKWSFLPKIAILMPISTVNESWLREAIQSIRAQIYPHWQLYLCYQNAFSTELTEYLYTDNRCHFITHSATINLATIFNHALESIHEEFIILMGAEDKLSQWALYQIVNILNQFPKTEIIYTDMDKIDEQGQRYDPYFKSDWNPDLFYSQNFLQYLTAYRTLLVKKIGGFQHYSGYEDYDLTLRLLEQIDEQRIQHLPLILYHQRQSLSTHPVAVNNEAAVNALQAHFSRLNQAVNVVKTDTGHTRVIYPLPSNPPLVSLIIPTRDKCELLRGTVFGILHNTDYQPLEVIIIDNGSVEPETLSYLKELEVNERVTVIRRDMPFNYSQLNNLGVARAKGEIIGLINNDLEVITPTWLREMVSHALRPKIGAVGAKLYYANDTLQHVGVIVGLGGMAGHGLKFLAREAPGYQWKPVLLQNYSAVTGACLVMRRDIFQKVGGLEEKHLKVAFNDVDLCLRIREQGYRIVWTPYAELYHLESASRGLDNTLRKYLRLRHELNYMKRRWGAILTYDPYYNPNLTIEYEDFSLAWPPRRRF